MASQNNLLQINNVEQVINSLVDFIKKQVYENFKKKGVVIGLSGGIDSSVIAALCVKALGPKNVLGVIMPEKESSPQSMQFAQKLAKKFEIPTKTIDITNILNSFDIYNIRNSVNKKYYSNFDDNCQYRIVVPQDLIERDGIGFPYLEIKERNKNILKIKLSYNDYLAMIAATTIKHRVRMINLYFQAEKNNFLVMGTTNKTEFVQGYYVKYGDGGVDAEPLIDLFKTQIFQLAEHLGIPEEIIKRKPSPDTWSLEVSDEEFFYRIPFHLFDVFWYHRENKLDVKIISEIFNLTDIETKRILNDQERKWNYSKHLRNLPPSWKSNAITKSKL